MAFNTQYFKSMPPVTKNLILVNLLVFLVMALIPGAKADMIERFAALHFLKSPSFNPAQIITYMFLHAGFTHFFFNMFALFMFGPMIEWAIGSKRFLFYYISCGIGAALIQEGVFAVMVHKYAAYFTPRDFDMIIRGFVPSVGVTPDVQALYSLVNMPTVGASGAIYGVLLAFGMLYPEREIMLLIPPIPIKAKWLVIGYGVLELVLAFGAKGDGVAHFCHLGGMLFGLLMILYWKKKGTFNGFY